MVTTGADNTDFSGLNVNHGNIESTTTKVINQNGFILTIVSNAVCNSSSSRLVNNSQNIQTSNNTSSLGSVTLSNTEVCRAGNNNIMNLLIVAQLAFHTEGILSILYDFLEDVRRNFFWLHINAVQIQTESRLSNATLNESYNLLGIHLCTFFCGRTNGNIGLCFKEYSRRGSKVTLCVFENNRLAILINVCNARISCTKVNTKYFSHDLVSFRLYRFNYFP